MIDTEVPFPNSHLQYYRKKSGGENNLLTYYFQDQTLKFKTKLNLHSFFLPSHFLFSPPSLFIVSFLWEELSFCQQTLEGVMIVIMMNIDLGSMG